MSGKNSTRVLNAVPSVQRELPLDLYRAIFTHSSAPIAILDQHGTYLEQNAAHAELFGYSNDELKNRTPATHLGEEVFAEVARELAEAGEYRGEVVGITKTGQIKYIELS